MSDAKRVVELLEEAKQLQEHNTQILAELVIKDLPSLDHIPPNLWKGTPKEKRE